MSDYLKYFGNLSLIDQLSKRFSYCIMCELLYANSLYEYRPDFAEE